MEHFLNLLDTSYVGVKTVGGTSCRIYSTMLDMREVRDFSCVQVEILPNAIDCRTGSRKNTEGQETAEYYNIWLSTGWGFQLSSLIVLTRL